MSEQSKLCHTCQTVRILDEFTRQAANPDGRKSVCKHCQKAKRQTPEAKAAALAKVKRWAKTTKGSEYRKKYAAANSEKNLAYQLRYAKTDKGVAARMAYRATPEFKARLRERQSKPEVLDATRKYFENRKAENPAEHLAQRAVNLAVRRGEMPHIKTQKCSQCEKQARHYHHDKGYDIEHWLDVIPVCARCHRLIHMREQFANN